MSNTGDTPLRALFICTLIGMSNVTTGCLSYVHAVNQDTLLATRGEPISVVGEKKIWFGMNGNNDYVAEAYQSLLAECPAGTIHSLSSRYSTTDKILFQVDRVRFAGVCVK